MNTYNFNETLLKNLESALDECEKFSNKCEMQPIIKALQDAYDSLFTLDHLGLMYDLSTRHWEIKASINFRNDELREIVPMKTIYVKCRTCNKVFSRVDFSEKQGRMCLNCWADYAKQPK